MGARILRFAQLVAASTLVTTAALAQADSTVHTDARWRPFVGCWASASFNIPGPTVCVVPTHDANTVELLELVRDTIRTRTLVHASGSVDARMNHSCATSDAAQWSADQQRLLAQAAVICTGDGTRRWSTLYAMTQADGFARIESTVFGKEITARVVTFTALDENPPLPADIRDQLPAALDPQQRMARASATAAVRNRSSRRALRDGGVPREVVAAMVAASAKNGANAGSGGDVDRLRGLANSVSCAASLAHYRGNFSCPALTPGGNSVGDHPALPPGTLPTNSLLGYETTLPRGIP